jgi:hypothetical protein
MKNRQGVTLVEIMLVAFILGLVTLVFVKLLSKTQPLLRRTQIRQQVVTGGRTTIDTLLQTLRGGKARTLRISTPGGATTSPNSRIDFELNTPLPSGTTAYAIYLDKGMVYLQEYRLSGLSGPKPLASHVTMLSFTADYRDPTLVSVNLQINASYDGTSDPGHVTSLVLSNQIAHLIDSQ